MDETLSRLTEDDVALDMDEIVVEDDEFIETDESDNHTDGDEGDVGWVDEEQQECGLEVDERGTSGVYRVLHEEYIES